jgi:Zn-dependent protease
VSQDAARRTARGAKVAERRGGGGLYLFRVAGIRIHVDRSWILIFLLVLWSLSFGYLPHAEPDRPALAYWVAGLAATLLFFCSILAHELAHSLTALRAGIPIPAITLFLFGGVSQMSEEPREPGTELRIAIAGPLMSFALAAVFWLLHATMRGTEVPLIATSLSYLAWVNTALGVFNLLPGLPLDGGRILRALVWWRTGSLTRATRLSSDMGKGLALGLMLLGALQLFQGALLGGMWLLFIGMFMRGMAQASYRNFMLRQMLDQITLTGVMIRDVVTVDAELSVADLIDDYFLGYGFRGFPVVEDGRTVGVVSLTDARRVPAAERSRTTVRDCMAPVEPARCIDPDATLTEAMERMTGHNFERLLVVRGGALLGMITLSGLARVVEMRSQLEEGEPRARD